MDIIRKVPLPHKRDRESLRAWLITHKGLSSAALAKQCGLTIDRMLSWKVQCDVVDPHDRKLFMVWIQYKDYTIPELAILAGVTVKAIRYYLRKYGIKKYVRSSRQFSNYRSRKIPIPVMDRSVMKDPARLRELYAAYGRVSMARMCGVSMPRMRLILRRYGILDSTRRWDGINNPYKNRDVLFRKYVIDGMTMAECASEAGTCKHTIRNWLVKFGIRPRDIHEAMQIRDHKKSSHLLTSTA